MKSLACFSSSVRAACQHTSACIPPSRGLIGCTSVDLTSRTVVSQPPCATGARPFHNLRTSAAVVQQVSAAPLPGPLPLPKRGEGELAVSQVGRRMPLKPALGPAPHFSPYSPYTRLQDNATALVNIQSLLEGDAIPELCSRLADFPVDERAEGLATLLGACAEFGLEAHSPIVLRLMKECQQLLPSSGIGVTPLCHLGEVVHALEGRQSATVTEVLYALGAAIEKDGVTKSEAVRVYSLLAHCHNPANIQQKNMLYTLHTHTVRLASQLQARQISSILESLMKLEQTQAIALVLSLSCMASKVLPSFSDDELIKTLSALMSLGQYHSGLLVAMEKHLPGRLGVCDPELISTVMEYCLQMKCRSESIFEAVAENFARHGEKHTTLQIAKQIVAMGRLNYLPQCSSEMFKKLESILSTRFSQFQPRSLIEVLHACIHLERIPLNYMSKVFSHYFLMSLLAQEKRVDRRARGQLTQLYLSMSLDCQHYVSPRMVFFPHVKKFSSVDQAFETPMENFLFSIVKGPLRDLLGGHFFNTRVLSHSGYTIDVEICLNEDGFVLHTDQWEQAHRRIALCLDGQQRFCSNTHHLLGKEATKRRHLRRIGYDVVQIPYFEYESLRTHKKRVEYLRKKIFPTVFKFNHKSSEGSTPEGL